MTARLRPIHSSFETLRLAGMAARTAESYNRTGFLANEQMTAASLARVARPVALHGEFIRR